MKRSALFGSLSLVAAALLVGEGDVGQAQKENPFKYGWHGNLAQAKQLAKQTGKPLMVVFRCEP